MLVHSCSPFSHGTVGFGRAANSHLKNDNHMKEHFIQEGKNESIFKEKLTEPSQSGVQRPETIDPSRRRASASPTGLPEQTQKPFKYNTVSNAATERRATAEIIFKHKNHDMRVGASRTTM